MIGTFFNVTGIVLGGIAGLIAGRNLPSTVQQQARLWLTALTVLTAAAVFWRGLTPPLGQTLKQVVIAVLALSLGSLTGHLLGLQRRLGQLSRWAAGKPGTSAHADNTTFATQAVVFAGNPLGILGAFLAGWTGDWRPLALKAGLDALAALGFAAAGSRNILLTVVPLAAVQGTLTLLAGAGAARFPNPALAASLQVVGGLFVLVMAPVIFGWRRVPLANYVPSLFWAPLLTAWWG